MSSDSRPVTVIHSHDTRELITCRRQTTDVAERVVFRVDLAGNFVFVNPAGELLSGYRWAELRHMNFTQLMSAQSAERLRAQLRNDLRRRFGTVYEIEVVTRQGRLVKIETSLHFVKKRGGSRIEIHGIALTTEETARGRQSPQCLHEQFTVFRPYF